MLPLFLIVFIDLVGFGLIIPLLPFYAEHFGAPPHAVALLMATYSFAQFLAAPYWGRLSDKIGRKPVLVMSMAGAVVAYTLMGFADTLWFLVAARGLAGFMAGNISAAFAYMADITGPENRAKGMGLIGAAFGLGFMIGPAIGGTLAGADPTTADFALPSFVAAGMSAIALVLTLILLKESFTAEKRAAYTAPNHRNALVGFIDGIKRPDIGKLLLLSFLATFVFAGMEATFAMWSERRFEWGPLQNGYLFAAVGLVSVTVQGGLMGRLARRFGEQRLITAGAFFFTLGLVGAPLSGSVGFMVLSMGLLALGFTLFNPALNSLMSLNAAPHEQGAVMGIARSATILGRVVGPAWAGMIFDVLGKDWPFFAGAIVMCAVVFMAARLRKQ